MPQQAKLVNRGAAGLLTKIKGSPEEKYDDSTLPQKGEINDIRCEGKVVDIDSLTPDPKNARQHNERNYHAIKGSLILYGQTTALVVRKENNHIAAGNGRWKSMKDLGWTKCAVSFLSMTDEEFHGYAVADNRTAELASWDWVVLQQLEKLCNPEAKAEASLIGWSLGELETMRATDWEEQSEEEKVKEANASLAERFVVPPFTVLDTRQGYWQDRKRAWIALGIKSEIGRGGNLVGHSDQTINKDFYYKKTKLEKELGKELTTDQARSILLSRGDIKHITRTKEDVFKFKGAVHSSPQSLEYVGGFDNHPSHKKQAKAFNMGLQGNAENNWQLEDDKGSGTSIFDPVLCELIYRWFSPPTGRVLDPFAGGSVRGIVASRLGRIYTGIDLSEPQIESNREQARAIVPHAQPTWIVGDSVNVRELVNGRSDHEPSPVYDLLLSCPPYSDLEVYSEDEADISTMEYLDFLVTYGKIIKASCSMLQDNRFACFVVGDVRDGKGKYRNFVSETISAFSKAGLELYNEMILVNVIGTLPVRVGKQFTVSRKAGKVHQNVLVFVKGDPLKAVEACGQVEVADDFLRETKGLNS